MVDLNVNLCLTTFGSGGQQVKGQKTNFIKTEAKSSDISYRYWPLNFKSIGIGKKKILIGRSLPTTQNHVIAHDIIVHCITACHVLVKDLYSKRSCIVQAVKGYIAFMNLFQTCCGKFEF